VQFDHQLGIERQLQRLEAFDVRLLDVDAGGLFCSWCPRFSA